MWRMNVLAILLAAGALWAEAPKVLAVRGAKIYTGTGAVIERGNVVVRDGLVEAASASAAIPPDAWIIEGLGLTVYPGFTNAMSNWGIPRAASSQEPASSRGRGAAPAGPVVRGPEDRPSNTAWLSGVELVQSGDAGIAQARDAGFTSAVVFPSTGIFAGHGSWINLAGDKPGQMVVASPLGQSLSVRTSGFTSFPGSLMGAFAYIRQVYLDADHYQAAKELYAKSPRGMRRVEYDRALEGVLASPRVLLPAATRVELERMAKFGAELKRDVVLYGGHDAARAIEAIKASGFPVLVSLQFPEKPKEANPDVRDSVRTLELREAAPAAAAALQKAGVKFAFYSGGIEKPSELRAALKKAIDAGLSREDAVRALTLSAAEIYGVADRVGSLEAGKIANLTVVDGDWFQERSKVKAVIVDGVKYEPAPVEAKKEEAAK
ncbi:MAG: amidohydrolase family protein [Bryobacterales bacterium]|nr:amidohydrolase family protein [Bryobacterales bacterium]